MNKVELMGRLTDDAELKYTASTNTPVATFNLAVNRRFAKKEDAVKADFFRVIAWNKTAEFVCKYFKKGQAIALTGRLETGRYEDKDGKTVFYTDVIAEEVFFAGQLKNNDAVQEQSENYMLEQPQVTDEDLPF